MSEVGVKGLDETLAVLSALPKNVQRNAVNKGLRAAAAIVRDEARYLAPERTGQLAKAIVSGSPDRDQDGRYSIRVYVDERKPHGYLGHFLEYGVDPHKIAAGGISKSGARLNKMKPGRRKALLFNGTFNRGVIDHPGHRAKPFLRPALDTKGEQAYDAMAFAIEEEVFNLTGFQSAAA